MSFHSNPLIHPIYHCLEDVIFEPPDIVQYVLTG
jgi:hypothetical protein